MPLDSLRNLLQLVPSLEKLLGFNQPCLGILCDPCFHIFCFPFPVEINWDVFDKHEVGEYSKFLNWVRMHIHSKAKLYCFGYYRGCEKSLNLCNALLILFFSKYGTTGIDRSSKPRFHDMETLLNKVFFLQLSSVSLWKLFFSEFLRTKFRQRTNDN